MSSARGRANHGLYLARILLSAWREALARQELPALVLAQAFHPAARNHLLDAYGWFLLALSQADPLPVTPPHSCAQVPPAPQGKVLAGEINELRQLETGGWLGAMLQESTFASQGSQRQGSLARVVSDQPDPEQVEHWLEHLAELFDRMGDSLDEY